MSEPVYTGRHIVVAVGRAQLTRLSTARVTSLAQRTFDAWIAIVLDEFGSRYHLVGLSIAIAFTPAVRPEGAVMVVPSSSRSVVPDLQHRGGVRADRQRASRAAWCRASEMWSRPVGVARSRARSSSFHCCVAPLLPRSSASAGAGTTAARALLRRSAPPLFPRRTAPFPMPLRGALPDVPAAAVAPPRLRAGAAS